MFRLSKPLVATLVLALAAGVQAQTATDIGTEMTSLAVAIPESCLTVCDPWRTAYRNCPVDTDATYSTCTCDATFIANFNACTGCMANELNAQGDTVNGPLATQAPTDLQNYCATAGDVVSSTSTDSLSSTSTDPLSTSTSTTDSSTSTTDSSTSTTDSSTSTTTTATPVATTSSTGSSSSSSSSTTTPAPVQTTPAVAVGGAFPSQTKSANVFTNGGEVVRAGSGVLAAVVAAALMI
ncbi:hypothetical protein JCM10212_005734 [Sporobolomyces blumeae]